MEQASMNERIQELLAKAGLGIRHDGIVLTRIGTGSEALGKFAELIVGDCLAQVDKMRDAFEEDGESKEALGAEWIGYAIEKHFGVK